MDNLIDNRIITKIEDLLQKARAHVAVEVNDADDNPPIGLILCTDKGNVDIQYALGDNFHISISASSYHIYQYDNYCHPLT